VAKRLFNIGKSCRKPGVGRFAAVFSPWSRCFAASLGWPMRFFTEVRLAPGRMTGWAAGTLSPLSVGGAYRDLTGARPRRAAAMTAGRRDRQESLRRQAPLKIGVKGGLLRHYR